MGLIAKLKSIFKKNIDCSGELNDKFFHFYTTSGRVVKLNSHIIVKEGFCAVMVCKDKVTDVLCSGKHKIDNSTIPLTFKLMKLYKIDEHGNSPHSFKCDFYFVNLSTQPGFVFTSNVPIVKRKDPLGKVVAYSEGVADIVVEDPGKLVQYLLVDNAYIKDKQALKEISLEIGNAVNKCLEKVDAPFETLLTNSVYINSFLSSKLALSFEFMGLKVSNITLHSFSMPAKLQKKVSELNLTNNKNSIENVMPEIEQIEGGYSMSLNGQIAVPMERENSTMQSVNNGYNYGNNQQFNDLSFGGDGLGKICHCCGNKINSTARFCEHCGFKQTD